MSHAELHNMNLIEDLNDLTFDELRELPCRVQMAVDYSLFD